MAKYWLHNGLLRKSEASGKIGGRGDRAESAVGNVQAGAVGNALRGVPEQPATSGGKMSRSAGAGGLADVIAAQGGERIRFFLLKTHYRSTVLYGEEGLAEAAGNLETFYRYFELRPATHCWRQSISCGPASSRRWTTTSTPVAPSLTCSIWCAS
jgi:cysteinyl-tRNA synthetase